MDPIYKIIDSKSIIGSIDSYNSKLKIFTEHKNRFGSVYLGKKGTYLYRKPTKIKTPQFTHLIAVAVYYTVATTTIAIIGFNITSH